MSTGTVNIDGRILSPIKKHVKLLCEANYLPEKRRPENVAHYKFWTDNQKAVLVSNLLGDGSLSSRDNYGFTARFRFVQMAKREEYVRYLCDIYSNYLTPQKYPLSRLKKSYMDKTHLQSELVTRSTPILSPYFRTWYTAGVKKLPLDFAKGLLNPLSVAIWYADDGIRNNTGGPALCTDNFSEEEIRSLADLLERSLGVISTVYTHQSTHHKTYKRLRINGIQNALKFRTVIKPRMSPCSAYKIDNNVSTRETLDLLH